MWLRMYKHKCICTMQHSQA